MHQDMDAEEWDMESLWQETARHRTFDALTRDIKTDVLIIGGGMAGLLCAHMLHQAGVDYALVEAQTICCGITKNTTAKITSQHGLLYDTLIRRFGTELAGQYLRANEAALEQYRRLCRKIDCDFEERDNFVYSVDDRGVLEREIRALDRLGFGAEFVPELPIPVKVKGAVKFPRQAQFHPLKFAFALAERLNIYEHTAVRELVGTTAITDRGRIKAQKIVIATHFPFLDKHGLYFLKIYQDRSYVIALENAQQVHGMYVDQDKKGLSFRNYGAFLYLGGGAHRTGKKGGGYQALRDFAAQQYPNAAVKYAWATQDCISLDGVPYIGRYSANTENLYVSSGFNKWGMTSSMAAAAILCDAIQGRENPHARVFDPSRSLLRPQLAINAGEAVVHLLMPTTRRCPHLGCALTWNKVEHSWDCACHGSRFTDDGKLIDNPATGNLKQRARRAE